MMNVICFFGLLILFSCSNKGNKEISSAVKNDGVETDDNIIVQRIKSAKTDKYELEIIGHQKNWEEEIFLIHRNVDTGRIVRIPIQISSQSILSAQFVDLVNDVVFFEVYEITHQGNGYYDLFEYRNGKVECVLNIRAVDRNQEGIGINGDSSFIIKDDRLQSEYLDINNDGLFDVKFSGIGYVIQGDLISDDEKGKLKNPIRLERYFVRDTANNRFVELIDKRKGFWYYDKYQIDY